MVRGGCRDPLLFDDAPLPANPLLISIGICRSRSSSVTLILRRWISSWSAISARLGALIGKPITLNVKG